jgi:hypothetical protein
MSTLVVQLMSWIVLAGGYEMPFTVPDVVPAPPTFFRERMCGGEVCNVVGLYASVDAPETVYVSDRFSLDGSDDLALSVLLHELVHYLQQKSGRWAFRHDCRAWVEQERQAYALQSRWLWQRGVPNRVDLTTPTLANCSEFTHDAHAPAIGTGYDICQENDREPVRITPRQQGWNN